MKRSLSRNVKPISSNDFTQFRVPVQAIAYRAVFPAVPVPPSRPALVAVFPVREAVVQSLIAVLSSAERVLAVAPLVLRFLMGVGATAGTAKAI